ncbi:MAG TPA: preprotein translocase subunit SecY [Aestuariivirga sp.]|jgi:preprotein translocase subunit SecY|nr:preprotein translocase subunit SecY [Hyphomicrobiales bacterium]MBZ0262014.1 preprotein translocase subunit SecY [Hyphomicrobiales bacterium]HQY74778.1 preprotein translocase subunit SecY [Aestuariivirga sp.]HRA92737.1 preprotein translocase subunit SecY [Aestuariivirga sp.]
MASAAEQLAANLNFGALAKSEDLKSRIWFTLGALIVYRLGTYIPIPGIDTVELARFAAQNSSGILGWVNGLAGGALGRMAIFALNIMPYISASIIMQLMTTVSPHLEALKKEGESGRKKMNQYTRYGTVILAALQAYGIAVGLEGQGNLVADPGLFFRASTVITLTGGTVFLMWLGEQITSRGIGNGISLIIFAGIVAGLPGGIAAMLELGRTGQLSTFVILGIMIMALGVVAFIVLFERAQRRLLIQYPKRQVGQKVFQGDSSHLPLKLNTAGVIPPIFASSLLLLPITVANFSAGQGPDWLISITALLGHGQPLFLALYVMLIIFFAFFYTSIMFNPKETAENLKKYGGFIPGIRPGERTAEYIDYVLTRVTVVGALYLSLVCLLPELLIGYTGVPFYFGGTSLLIVVSVTMDTVAQLQGHLYAQQYEGLIKKSKLRGNRK